MDRKNFLLKFAQEKKFAYMAEQISVCNLEDAQSSSDFSYSEANQHKSDSTTYDDLASTSSSRYSVLGHAITTTSDNVQCLDNSNTSGDPSKSSPRSITNLPEDALPTTTNSMLCLSPIQSSRRSTSSSRSTASIYHQNNCNIFDTPNNLSPSPKTVLPEDALDTRKNSILCPPSTISSRQTSVSSPSTTINSDSIHSQDAYYTSDDPSNSSPSTETISPKDGLAPTNLILSQSPTPSSHRSSASSHLTSIISDSVQSLSDCNTFDGWSSSNFEDVLGRDSDSWIIPLESPITHSCEDTNINTINRLTGLIPLCQEEQDNHSGVSTDLVIAVSRNGRNLSDCNTSNSAIRPFTSLTTFSRIENTNRVDRLSTSSQICQDSHENYLAKSQESLISDDTHQSWILANSAKHSQEDFVDFENSGSEYLPSSSSSSGSEVSPQINMNRFGKGASWSEELTISETYGSRNANIDETLQVDDMNIDNPLSKKGHNDVKKTNNSDVKKYSSEGENAGSSTGPSMVMCKRNHSVKERPTICPICYNEVTTHFPRHLFRHHSDNKDVKLIKSQKPGSKERLTMIASLRRQGYFQLSIEKKIITPIRTSKEAKAEYFVCSYCLGYFTKKLLYKHVKICKHRPNDVMNPGKNCLAKSQTFLASAMLRNHEFLKKLRIHKEVFESMRADDITCVAKSDPLICLYGEHLISKHKRQQMSKVVSSRMREMANLVKVLKVEHNEITGLFDLLKPSMFRKVVMAAKVVSGYEESTKCFRAPSLALHFGTRLKIVCDVAFKILLEERTIPNIQCEDREEKKREIKYFRKLVESHWCNELASLALKNLKEKQWEKPTQLPLTSDILLFKTYLNTSAEDAYNELSRNINVRKNYKTLTECTLAQTVMFNRKRVGDVQYLKIETYKKEHSTTHQEAFAQSLTTVEKILSKQFERVVTGGKGSKPFPILFSKRIQAYISCLLNTREKFSVVPETNPYLFANPDSVDKCMAGSNIIRRLANSSGAKEPSLLTSTRFRKHIATTLQLMSMQPDEMEQVATFMGHTKKTHDEFYRLPQDIYQTAKVAKVLLLLEKGKGEEFKGKTLSEIELEKDVYYSSESNGEDEEEQKEEGVSKYPEVPEHSVRMENHENNAQRHINEKKHYSLNAPSQLIKQTETDKGKTILKKEHDLSHKILIEETAGGSSKSFGAEHREEKELLSEISELRNTKDKTYRKSVRKNISSRVSWEAKEKGLVLNYFKQHVKNKMTPKKYECEDFLRQYGNNLTNKDWVKVKTLVYNTFRQK